MKIVLLTNDSIQTNGLALLLKAGGLPLVRVITVRKRRSDRNPRRSDLMRYLWRRLWSYIRTSPRTRKALRLEYLCEQEATRQLAEWIDQRLAGLEIRPVKSTITDSVNSVEVHQILEEENPDLCLVWGTGILSSKTLSIGPAFINVHTSILPHYRGTRSEFWQCYHQDFQNLGVTFHYIDKGVDTGGIIEQVHLPQEVIKEPFLLRLENTKLILNEYPRIVRSLLDRNIPDGLEQPMTVAKTYKYSDITKSKRAEVYGRLLSDDSLKQIIQKKGKS